MKILAISGSLRHGSSNMAILHAAAAIAAPSLKIEIFPDLGALPYFNPDLDREDPPRQVQIFREALASSSALLISTPEYAHGIPGVLKNALDWLVSDVKFVGKAVGLIFGSASTGTFAQESLKEVLKTMSARVIDQAVINIPGARAKLGPDGRLMPDEGVTESLRRSLRALELAGLESG